MPGIVIVCNGTEALVVCVLDEPVLRWLDVGCMVAMGAFVSPCEIYDSARYLLPESQQNRYRDSSFEVQKSLAQPRPWSFSILVSCMILSCVNMRLVRKSFASYFGSYPRG